MLLKSTFIGEITPLKGVKLQEVGGTVIAVGYGTIRFNIYDNEGTKQTFTVHNVRYVSDASMNLLSPQNDWQKEQR